MRKSPPHMSFGQIHRDYSYILAYENMQIIEMVKMGYFLARLP